MRRPHTYGFLMSFLFFWLSPMLEAQETNARMHCLPITRADTLVEIPDSLILLPATVQLFNESGDSLPTTLLSIEGQKVRIAAVPPNMPQASRLCFRYLSPEFTRWYFRRQQQDSLIDSITNTETVSLKPPGFQLPDRRQLDYSGSFTRGFSFGNRQDLVLNSNFNLQMSGELGDGVQVRAAITDENIPLQAEGNTQQLQEFDQVFIELSKEAHRLKAGDYEISSGNSYFSRYFKKLQGLTYQYQDENPGLQVDNQVSAALTRGKFTRTILEPIEGNQGPYKLRGAQGERFVIILSGTERVWINGQEVQRGIEEDYIIDYNLGEITFTNRQLIRRETRIIIEFEYVEQSYARSIIATKTQLSTQKHQISLQVFSQQDSRNPSGFSGLTEADQLALAQAGDDPQKTRISSIRPLEDFSPAQVAYVQRTLETPCGTEEILVFSNEQGSDLKTATFAFAGPGEGLYRQAPADVANELVYEYVGRDSQTCRPLGDFSPNIQLAPPQSQQLLTLRDEWQLDEGTTWQTELAWSNVNANRFSDKDAADNQGLGLFTNFRKVFNPQAAKDSWQASTALSYEYKSQSFQALNPYRDPEFLRDWSLANFNGQGQTQASTEHLIRGSLSLQHAERGQVGYQLGSFLRPGDFSGIKHHLLVDYEHRGWLINSNSSFLEAQTNTDQRRFFRPDLRLGRTFNGGEGWQAQLQFMAEDRQERQNSVDSLLSSSYAFYQYAAELKSPDRWANSVSLRFQQREDQLPEEEALQAAFSSRELGLESSWQLSRQLRVQADFTYRNLQTQRPNVPLAGKSGDKFLGRINAVTSLAKGLLRSSINYNIGGGQEPERTFSYVRVRKGEGLYIWLDSLYNNDGIIQPNEMEISPFPDQAEYVRVSTFSDNFIQTNNVDLNWSWQISPRALLFKAQSGFGRFLGRFSTQSSLKISRRTQAGKQVQAWNPFQLDVADTSLIATTAGTRHLIFFNRGQTDFDIQLGWSDSRRKFVQNTGFESRTNATKFFKLRWKPAESWIGNLALELNDRSSDSEFFDNKDFQIVEQVVEPRLSWLPGPAFSLETHYRLAYQEDRLRTEDFRSRSHDLGLEVSWNKDARTSLQQSFSYINVNFSGQANTPVGFAMLNGLQPGNNLIWNLGLNRQLGQNLQLQLSYEGRKTGMAPVVHVGRAQVSAIF
ncbi:MAG TPA: hypothetical protein VJ953_06325 [Saprospiraceae bacterium]|nr:hypothetical protein [Saprospiraceae bacterium]